jgi:folate-binding protein YgfZ
MTNPGTLRADYHTLTAECGFVELAHWSTIVMTGQDRQTLLHNLSTNDIGRLTPGTGCEAFCTDVKGKLVAHVWVLAHANRLELLTLPAQAPTLIAHLDRYLIREDVQLADASAESVWFVLRGAKAGDCLAKLGASLPLAPWQHQTLTAPPLTAFCFPPLGASSYLLRTASEHKAALENALESAGAKRCGDAATQAVRIEAGLPLFPIDFSGANLPQEVNRDDQAISFRKGCYLGQETVARIDALGHVNQKLALVRFSADTLPVGNLALRAGDAVVGQTSSLCWSPGHHAPLALAMLKRGFHDVGTQLESDLGPAEVILPNTDS